MSVTSNEFIASLEEQVDCYRRLAKLAEQQHEHVERNHTEALLDVLVSRRQTLDEINRIEAALAPAKQHWGDYLASLALDVRARAEALMNETRALLEQITTADRNDVLVLQARKINLGRQINQAKAARSVNRTYGAACAHGSSAVSNMDIQQ
jgi:hypothetical protein